MIRATLNSPAAAAQAQQALAPAAQPATRTAPATAAPAQPRAAVAPRAPAGVITPRGGTTVAPLPKPQAPVTAQRIAPRLQGSTPTPAAPTPVAPRPVAAPVLQAPAPVPVAAPVEVVAPVPGTPAAKPRKPRAPKPPAQEVVAELVETPVEGVLVESYTGGVPEVTDSPAGTVDEQLFGTTEPQADPNAQAPEEAYPTDPNEQPLEAEPVAEPSAAAHNAALAVRPPAGAVARTSYGGEGSGIEGDWGSEDLRFPQLKIVQGSGQLSAQFDNGTVILADNILFNPPSVNPGAVNPLLYFVPLSVKKQWRENLSKEQQAEGLMPRVVDSIDEVEQLGGSTLWIGNQKPGWSPSARCLFLLEQPADVDHPNFVTELDGRNYAVAVYYAGGTAFNNSAKVIFNTGITSLQVPVLDGQGQPQKDPAGRVVKRTMLYKNLWTMQWNRKQSGEYMVWQPQVRILAKEETGPEVRSYIEGILNSQGNFAVAAEEP